MKVEKFLYRPTKDFYITQLFGEDKVCILNSNNKTLVYKEDFNKCPTGYRSLYSQMKGHNGIDVRTPRWLPMYALQNGWVPEVCTEEARGLGVGIVTNDQYYCEEINKETYFKYRMWHFIALNVHEGDKVKTGQLVGWADSTGYSTGDHLHLEIKPVEISYDNSGKAWVRNALQNNGYFGAIDPLPYMEPIFVLQVRDWNTLLRRIKEQVARIADSISDLSRS